MVENTDELRMLIEANLIDAETAVNDRNGLNVTLRFTPEDLRSIILMQQWFLIPMEEWMKQLILGEEQFPLQTGKGDENNTTGIL